MMGYPLQSLLDLRLREHEAASECLADATRKRQSAEKEEVTRESAATAAQERWREASGARMASNGPTGSTGAQEAAAARFIERLRVEWKRAESALEAFRSGELAAAVAADDAARERCVAARNAYQVLSKHEAMLRQSARLGAERREEERLEESTRAQASANLGWGETR